MKSIFFAFCAVCLCAPVFAEDEGLEEEETSETVEKVTVSENNKKKKAQILALCRLPADYSSAGKWFKLAKGIEADGLRQFALKASASALLYSKKQKVYNSNIKPLLDDPKAFESSLNIQCSKCQGEKNIVENCEACSATGQCGNPNCNNGYRVTSGVGSGFNVTQRWTKCTDCKGTARCKKCKGMGRITKKCAQCNGKGVVFSREAAVKAYRDCVKWISISLED